MTSSPHLPGYKSLDFLGVEWMRTGVYTGICSSFVLIAWIVIANRVPVLERFALVRNVGAAGAIALLMIFPAVRYVRSPLRLFLAGVSGWGLFSLVYRVMEFFFNRLDARMGAFHVFILGAMVYTIAAVIAWIASLVLAARKPAVPASGHRTR